MVAPESLNAGKHDRRPGAAKSRSELGREKCPSLLAPSNLSNLSAHFRQIPIMGVGPRCAVQEGALSSFLVCFYLIGFLVGHPGQVGPLQQNQALLASNLRSGAWTRWTDR